MDENKLDEIGSSMLEVLESLKEYCAIGTVEECKRAMERMTPMKPVDKTMVLDRDDYVGDIGKCPICGSIVTEDDTCCPHCYQVLDWVIEKVSEIKTSDDQFTEEPAKILPDGWLWKIYNNGTGHLVDPDGDKHYIYGITLDKKNRIKYQEFEGAKDEFFHDDFRAFQNFAENSIFADAMCPDDDDEWLETTAPDYVEEAAESLPEGWYWKMFDDGSGSIRSPEGESYYSYNKATYRTQIEYHKRDFLKWEIFKGSFKEYQRFAEEEVRKTLQ